MVSSLLSITLPFFYPLSSSHLSTPPLWFPAHASIYPLFIFPCSHCWDLSSSASTLILVVQPFSPHFHPVSRATSSTWLRVCVRTRVCVPSMQKEPQKKDLELQKSVIMQMNPASDNGLQQDLSPLIEAVWKEL